MSLNRKSPKVDPRIHLGIDNCFAIKRWTTPMAWGKAIKDMGLQYVEAVPDLECEPLLTPTDYRKDWVEEVKRMQEELGEPIASVIATGGTSQFVVPLCRHKIIYDKDLLLKGLAILYENELQHAARLERK